jgi:hypothetical protein
MQVIQLSKIEYDYLSKADFLPNKLRKLFPVNYQNKVKYLLEITEDQADEIRDLCGEQLQIVGFNERYEATSEGEILESLVDKFFF